MALDFFSPRDQAKIKAAIRMLGDPDSAALVQARSAMALTPEPMYVMRVSPQLRILYSQTENEVEILDVVFKDKLRAFAKMAAEAEEAIAKKTADSTEVSRSNGA